MGKGVVLVGMPGAGKSTVGVLLAKRLGLAFVDTDLLIQERAGGRLQDIVDAGGHLELRRREEEAILALGARGAVVATGGSAVYSARAMEHLARGGTLVYLRAGLGLLESRIDDLDRRGIANRRRAVLRGDLRGAGAAVRALGRGHGGRRRAEPGGDGASARRSAGRNPRVTRGSVAADVSPGLVLRGLLLTSDRVARLKRFLTSPAPVFVTSARLRMLGLAMLALALASLAAIRRRR